jgi:probable HAF family extracellular repeat protein
VGITVNASGVATGFVRELAGPTCVPVSVPGAISTWPADINDAGQVVGHFVDPASVQHGFVWAAGVYTVLDVPGASWTIADGINEAGRVVGSFWDGTRALGFILTDGVFTRVFVNGDGTGFNDVNNTSQFVGTYAVVSGIFSFTFVVDHGAIVPVRPLFGTRNYAAGVNDHGVVVGNYTSIGAHAFVATPIVDSDIDGIPDPWEIQFGLDPEDPTDAAQDADGDGSINIVEFVGGSDPTDNQSAPVSATTQDDVGRTLKLVVPPGVDMTDPGFEFGWINPAGMPDRLRPGTFPYGLVSLRLPVAPGATVDVAVTFQGPVDATSLYYKYGATSANPSDHWYAFPFGSRDGDATITLTVTDGGDGDHDRVKNGVIVDPGGPFLPGPTALLNISARAFVGTGSNAAVGGFMIGGTGTKQVLIRGFGPTLADFGITGALANPTLELYWDNDNNPSTPAILVLTDNDWGATLGSCPAPVVVCGSPTDIQNTGLSANTYAPTNPSRGLDAALLLTLPPGTYTARLSGVSGGTGVGLIGVDDVDANETARLINISTRAFVGTGANVEVAGFVISGTTDKQVLIRGFGPTLSSFGINGALANPALDLYLDDDNNPNTPAIFVLSNDD